MDERGSLRAVCGLDCAVCDIRLSNDDPALAKQLADWFERERGIDAKPEQIRCTWCKGKRDGHWSPDCWILRCCVDEKGHEFCHECDDFPCDKLEEWSKGSERYGEAFEWLQKKSGEMRGVF